MLLLYASKDCASRVESLHKAWPTVLVGVIFSSPGQTYAAERFSVICVALVSAAVGPRLALPMMVILTPSFDGTGPFPSPGYLIRFNRCICGWPTSCRMMRGTPIKLGNLQASRGGRFQSGIPAVVNVDRRQQQNL
jgi:hypothetical protein